MRELIEILNEHVAAGGEDGKEDKRVWFVANELQHKLQDLEEALQRLVARN